MVLMEGGQWIWPPVDVGFSRVIPGLVSPDTSTRSLAVLTKHPNLMQRLCTVYFQDFTWCAYTPCLHAAPTA